LQVVSNSGVVSDVSGTTLTTSPPIAPKGLTVVAELASWPGLVEPIGLLHLVGEALTPQLSQTEFDFSAQWALFRYAWAFAGHAPPLALRLSEPAGLLVDHHCTALSEHLGIAFGLHVSLWVLQQRHPGWEVDFVDADVALSPLHAAGSGFGLQAVAKSKRMRPDYFLVAADPDSELEHVYALECKGSHSPTLYKTQMKKAASQVGGVAAYGAPPASFVSATHLSEAGITVRVLDPDGGEGWSGPADFSEEEADLIVEESRDKPVEIVDPDRFRGRLSRVADGRRLAWAGQYERAAAEVPEAVRRRGGDVRRADAELETATSVFGDVAVRRAVLPLGADALEVSQGLLSAELETLLAPAPERRLRRRDRRLPRWSRSATDASATIGQTARGPDGASVASVSPDGTFLSLRLV
jgi:hypothetical protein